MSRFPDLLPNLLLITVNLTCAPQDKAPCGTLYNTVHPPASTGGTSCTCTRTSWPSCRNSARIPLDTAYLTKTPKEKAAMSSIELAGESSARLMMTKKVWMKSAAVGRERRPWTVWRSPHCSPELVTIEIEITLKATLLYFLINISQF